MTADRVEITIDPDLTALIKVKGNYFKKMTYFCTMKMFRSVFFRKVMTIVTGLLVMNMSLFLAEVEALKLLKTREMKVNIYKLLAGAANEEEKDFSQSSEEEAFTKETILFSHDLKDFSSVNDAKEMSLHCWASFDTKAAYRETLSPPPKG